MSMSSRFRRFVRSSSTTYLFLILSVISIIFPILSITKLSFIYFGQPFRQSSPLTEFLLHENASELLVNTSQCKIINTGIWPQYWKVNWNKSYVPDCTKAEYYARLTDNNILVLNQRFENSTCQILPIIRDDDDDNRGRYLDQIRLVKTASNVSSHEMFAIQCDNGSLNFAATIPSPAIKVPDKIQHWKGQRNWLKENVPISVLLIGLDSTSRAHAYRSFPETMSLLKKLGFVDLQGHHSVSAYTLHNFYALLAGSTMEDIFTGCMYGWESRSYTDCPWIWNHFDLLQYVTLYMEDHYGSFNSQSDKTEFAKPPTDYYIHPLLVEMHKYWLQQPGGHEKGDDCASSAENAPQLLLNYLRRFVKKVSTQAPFFAFTFFASPFHDHQLAHKSLDGDFESFFHFLNQSGVLQRTLVIFTADHGDRDHFFSSGPVGYLERSLPLMFIRLPEALINVYPKFRAALELNSHMLTSHFDTHATLLELLTIRGSMVVPLRNAIGSAAVEEIEEIIEPYGHSLFKLLPVRNCADIQVEQGMCVCDTGVSSQFSTNDPSLMHSTVMVAIRELNRIIQNSRYGDSCAIWTPEFEPLRHARIWVINETALNRTVLSLVFGTEQKGKFQVHVEIGLRHGTSSNRAVMRTVGDFKRVNSYGNSSSCMNNLTPWERTFRELCLCKNLA